MAEPWSPARQDHNQSYHGAFIRLRTDGADVEIVGEIHQHINDRKAVSETFHLSL